MSHVQLERSCEDRQTCNRKSNGISCWLGAERRGMTAAALQGVRRRALRRQWRCRLPQWQPGTLWPAVGCWRTAGACARPAAAARRPGPAAGLPASQTAACRRGARLCAGRRRGAGGRWGRARARQPAAASQAAAPAHYPSSHPAHHGRSRGVCASSGGPAGRPVRPPAGRAARQTSPPSRAPQHWRPRATQCAAGACTAPGRRWRGTARSCLPHPAATARSAARPR